MHVCLTLPVAVLVKTFLCLLISDNPSSSWDPDQDQQNVRPDLYLILIVFMIYYY